MDETYDELIALGTKQIHESKFSDAIATLESAVQLDSNQGRAHGLLGIALFKAGDADKGIKALHRAATLQPDDAPAQFN